MKKKTFRAKTSWPASAELNIISYTIARHNKTHSVQKIVYNVMTTVFFFKFFAKIQWQIKCLLIKKDHILSSTAQCTKSRENPVSYLYDIK